MVGTSLEFRASTHRCDRVAILRPRLLVIAERGRAVLAIADRGHARTRNAPRDQIVTARIRSPLAERKVVFLGAAVVAVAGNLNVDLRILRQPTGLPIKG